MRISATQRSSPVNQQISAEATKLVYDGTGTIFVYGDLLKSLMYKPGHNVEREGLLEIVSDFLYMQPSFLDFPDGFPFHQIKALPIRFSTPMRNGGISSLARSQRRRSRRSLLNSRNDSRQRFPAQEFYEAI